MYWKIKDLEKSTTDGEGGMNGTFAFVKGSLFGHLLNRNTIS